MSDSQDEISTEPGLVAPPAGSTGANPSGSSSQLSGWPSVMQAALLAGSNAVSAYIAYLLAKPVAAAIPELLLHYKETGWAPPTIAGGIVTAIAAPLGLKYAGRLVGAGTGLVSAIKGLAQKGSSK